MLRTSIFVALIFSVSCAGAQQAADPDYRPLVKHPTHEKGTGPIVAIDSAHFNFHTRNGRYAPFSRLLEADGFRVTDYEDSFNRNSLLQIFGKLDEDSQSDAGGTVPILVIANALHPSNQKTWKLPTPSAFEDAEIDALEHWVRTGGSLLLIADHMPFPGAAAKLGERLGVEMANGFVFKDDESGNPTRGPMTFTRTEAFAELPETASLGAHPVLGAEVNNESSFPKIRQVATFTGQAFRQRGTAISWHPLLTLPRQAYSLEPETAWAFDQSTTRREVGGWMQGGCAEIGSGRVAIFGEAAMFTSQRVGNTDRRMGMTAEEAVDNQQCLLNVVGWLSRSRK